MADVCAHAYFDTTVVPIGDARLPLTSSAVLYGLSVYTVFPVLVTEGKRVAFRLEDHFSRLLSSARIIGIDTFEPAWTIERFMAAVVDTVEANGIERDTFMRATVHVVEDVPGTRSRGLRTMLSIFGYRAEPIVPQNGARLKTSVWRRVPDYAIPSRAKVNGAYVNSVLGKQDAIDSGYDDCIFLDAGGHVCELSAANIFMVRDGVLITPDHTSDILEGINRRTVLTFAQDMGIPVRERSIDLTELYVADEVFACGTSAFVAPVVEVDARRIGGGVPGTITTRIRARYDSVLRGLVPEYTRWTTQV